MYYMYSNFVFFLFAALDIASIQLKSYKSDTEAKKVFSSYRWRRRELWG